MSNPRTQRSDEAKAYRRLYNTKRWKAVRALQLSAFPLCERCKQRGILHPATVAHHTIPHKGDAILFFGVPLESLCTSCHDGSAQADERRGYTVGCDVHGQPLDTTHHWHVHE